MKYHCLALSRYLICMRFFSSFMLHSWKDTPGGFFFFYSDHFPVAPVQCSLPLLVRNSPLCFSLNLSAS